MTAIPIRVVIGEPVLRVMEHVPSTTEWMERELVRRPLDITLISAVVDRLQDDGLAADETYARVMHLAQAGAHAGQIADAVARLAGQGGAGSRRREVVYCIAGADTDRGSIRVHPGAGRPTPHVVRWVRGEWSGYVADVHVGAQWVLDRFRDC